MQRITRSRSDRILAGVCGGVAQYFSIDPTIVRLIWVFFTLFGGSGLLAYIIAAIMIPEASGENKSFQLESIKENPIWGILLIVVGIILFLRYDHIIFMFWDTFWDNLLNVLLAIFLVGMGIFLLYSKSNETKSIEGKDTAWEPLHLSTLDKKLAGVCGGFGETLKIDPTIIRVLWVFGTLMSVGIGILLYIVLALVLPERSVTAEDI